MMLCVLFQNFNIIIMNATLYNDKYSLGLEELNKIYIALLTTSELVYLNANVEINKNLSIVEQKHIISSLNQLEKKGLLKYWCFPNDKFHHDGICHDSLIELNKDKYKEYSVLINNVYFNKENLVSLFQMIQENDTNKCWVEETTSKILLCRREYWCYAIMKMLEANSLINSFNGILPRKALFNDSSVNPNISNYLVKELFFKSNLSFSSLSGDDIAEFCSNTRNQRLKKKIIENDSSINLDSALNQAIEWAKQKENKSISSVVTDVMALLLPQPLSNIVSMMKLGAEVMDENEMSVSKVSFLLYKTQKRAIKHLEKKKL